MKTEKRIDLGEYIIVIEYDNDNGFLDVTVLDELEGVIEYITVTNDDEDEVDEELEKLKAKPEENKEFNPNLN